MSARVSGVYDLAVVGAGIVGLAHALAAARLGKRVVVIDRDAQATGASIRNFGFVTVTGQQAGACWRRARRSRDIWAEVAPAAGIAVEHAGLIVTARRPEAATVLEAFAATEMGEACTLLTEAGARARWPVLAPGPLAAAMYSPHELRVESRWALTRLALWLEQVHGVMFLWRTAVFDVAPPEVSTSAGVITAEACVVCPNADDVSLFAHRLADYGLSRCTLQMMRLAPPAPGWRLPAAVMSDLSLVRYLGYAELTEARALRAVLAEEAGDALAAGVHLIVVQSGDGSLVVGDSHVYDETEAPFATDAIERIILDEARAVLALPTVQVTERWIGVYPWAPGRLMLVDRPSEAVRVVLVTSGTGASTAFAIAEEVIADMFGHTVTNSGGAS